MLILYAEDDPEDAEVFCDALKAIDTKIVCAMVGDGREVIPYLEKTTELPDYIFLDINMPKMNGKDCLARLKQTEKFSTIPVVMYTTSTLNVDQQESMKLGAMAYLAKPTTYKDLVQELKELLGRN